MCLKIRNGYSLICVFVFYVVCFVFTGSQMAYAEERSTEGTAYAVLEDDGDLILFRSNNTYTDGTGQTVTDILGNTYTGRVYTGIETTNINDYRNSKWYSENSSVKTVKVADGQKIMPVNCYYWFCKCSNMTSADLKGLDTGNVTNMGSMFSSCSNLTALDVSGWDTGNVTNMFNMFGDCLNLTTLDVSGWDTGNVTNMNFMFHSCSLTTLDVSGWDTGNVTRMDYMFETCPNLTTLDVSEWNTGNVTSMEEMFRGCSNLTTLDVSGWDTGNVTSMGSMFQYCSKLTTLDVSGWDTGNVTGMSSMFYRCSSLTALDVSGWDTGNVTSMYGMFRECSNLTALDVSGWDTGNVTIMNYMFSSCSNLTTLDVSGWDTENVTKMQGVFYGCSKLTTLDVSGWDTRNVTNMQDMFTGCSNLTTLDVSGWNTGKVTGMTYMFDGCSNLTTLDVSGWDTGNVTDMSSMFSGCSKLSSVMIGEDFRFKGKNIASTSYQAVLPTPPTSTTTGKWIKEDKSVEAKTPEELRSDYDADASTWAGKWIWELKTNIAIINFDANGGYTEQGQIQQTTIEPITIPDATRPNYYFISWTKEKDGSGTEYQPSDQYTPTGGELTTFYAQWTLNPILSSSDGEVEIDIKGGESITLKNLPGGAIYQVLEETPSGWQLVNQTNPAGTVPANGKAEAVFTNQYVPGTATISLIAQKTLDGYTPDDGEFQFTLSQNGNVLDTASNNTAGIVQFDQLTFNTSGVYTYEIQEVRGNNQDISYDSHTETVTIEVTDDGHGNLTAISSAANRIPLFENETKPGILKLRKQATGGTGDEVFTFVVTLTNEYGQPLDHVNVIGATQ